MIKYGNFIVVIDACVLYQRRISDLLLSLAEYPAELYQARWSHQIIAETVRNLIDDKRMNVTQAEYFKSELFNAFEDAYIDGYENLIPVLNNHEKDRHVLAVAIVSGAQVIVTHNIRHYPPESLEFYNIEAQTPDTFLQNLFYLSPAIVIGTFKKIQERLTRPSYTEQELLDRYRIVAPKFTKQLEETLSHLDRTVESILNQELKDFLSQN